MTDEEFDREVGRPLTYEEFDERLRGLRPILLRYAVSLCNDHNDAEDIVQNACVCAWKNRCRFTPETFRPYLFKATKWAHLDALPYTPTNRNKMEVETEPLKDEWYDEVAMDLSDTSPVDPAPTPEEAFIESLIHPSLISAINGLLDPRHRQALILTYIGGLTAREAAPIAGCTRNALLNRMMVARGHIKASLSIQDLKEVMRHSGQVNGRVSAAC